MSTIRRKLDKGFRQDGTVFVSADWDQYDFIFYTDDAKTIPVDFSGSVFSGEVLDEMAGGKLFDLTFNTPANDGNVSPRLDDLETATLTGRTAWFWVKVTTGTAVEAYFFGKLTVSKAFIAGT